MKKIKDMIDNIIAIHVGDTIKDELECLGMTQSEFAKRLGVSEKHISKILNGESGISAEMAIKLESVLGITASFWMRLEATYQEDLAKKKTLENMGEEWIFAERNINYEELINKNWIPSDEKNNPFKILVNLRSFFNVANITYIQDVESDFFASHQFRLKSNTPSSLYSILSFIRKGEIDSQDLKSSEYKKDILIKNLEEIKKVSQKNSKNSILKIKNLLLEAGVGFVVLENLSNSYVKGITKWVGGKPLIILSTLNETVDMFLFSLFHEIGHLLKHSKKEIYVNIEKKGTINLAENEVIKHYEEEADEYARNILIPNSSYEKIKEHFKKNPNNYNYIKKCAKELNIHPSIIIGRFQKDKIIKKENVELNNLKEKIIFI